jgi:hypothetical protein
MHVKANSLDDINCDITTSLSDSGGSGCGVGMASAQIAGNGSGPDVEITGVQIQTVFTQDYYLPGVHVQGSNTSNYAAALSQASDNIVDTDTGSNNAPCNGQTADFSAIVIVSTSLGQKTFQSGVVGQSTGFPPGVTPIEIAGPYASVILHPTKPSWGLALSASATGGNGSLSFKWDIFYTNTSGQQHVEAFGSNTSLSMDKTEGNVINYDIYLTVAGSENGAPIYGNASTSVQTDGVNSD